MRNFESEIEELKEELKILQLQSRTLAKETQKIKNRLNSSEAEKRSVTNISNDSNVRDCCNVTIKVGDWVKILTQGRFIRNEGRVVNIKKWVTFEDKGGIKQVRAPQNLIVIHDGGKRS